MQGIAGYFQIAQTKICRKEPQRIRNKFKRQQNNTFNKIKNRFKCYFGIGCLQRGFMRRFDNDPDNTSHDNTRNYDSLYDYDDYEEDF